MHAWEIQKNCIDDLIQKQIWRYRLRKQMHGYQQEKGNGMNCKADIDTYTLLMLCAM